MQTLTATGFGTRELTMTELDLVSGGWNWNKVDRGKAAALGGVGSLGDGIAAPVETLLALDLVLPVDFWPDSKAQLSTMPGKTTH